MSPDWNYDGQGKGQGRETWDSMVMLAVVLLIFGAALMLAVLTGAALALEWVLGWIGR